MKYLSYILTFLMLMSCSHSNSEKISEQDIPAEIGTFETKANDIESKQEPGQNLTDPTGYDRQDLRFEFEKALAFKLTDTLSADFNGDGIIDHAVFINYNSTSGIAITHGGTNQKIKIGFGEPFAHLTEFNWVDFWGLVYDSETYEAIIEDGEIIKGRKVKLGNPSIAVRKQEVGGGLISFRNGKYVWIHQAD